MKQADKIVAATSAKLRSEEVVLFAWPDLEADLYRQFLDWRDLGRRVNQAWFRRRSKAIFRSLYHDVDPATFQFSQGWFNGFLDQHRISLRFITKKSQQTPTGYLRRGRRLNFPKSIILSFKSSSTYVTNYS